MQTSAFTRAFLLMFSGPIIWAAHFFAIYGVTGLACARQFAHEEWFGVSIVLWTIGAITLAALAAILLIVFKAASVKTARDDARFIQWITAGLGLFSIVAIFWEITPAALLPICA
jgi:hypothetical protein